jgi:hypothetical protein
MVGPGFGDARGRVGGSPLHEITLGVSADDAAALLNDPARWVLGTADGHVMLSLTHEGQAHEYPEWLGLAEKAKDGT